MIFFIFCLIVTILLFLFHGTLKPKKYPPGPKWFPIVGNLFFYKKIYAEVRYHHEVWATLTEMYGLIVGLKLGNQLVVGVSGPKAVKEILTREEFEGRPDGFFFRLRTFGKKLVTIKNPHVIKTSEKKWHTSFNVGIGVVFSDGPLWKKQRKFSLQHLRKFGFGRYEMEEIVHQETQALVNLLKQQTNEPIFIDEAFGVSVINSLWAMLAGKRFDLEDQRLSRLLQLVNECFKIVDFSGGLINQMPFLRFIIPNASGYNSILKNLREMWAFLEETIQDHKSNSDRHAEPRDLIDAFLNSMHVKSDPSFTDDQLMSLCLDLFMAGSETTSNTLGFAAMYMILFPEVQKKVQHEIDTVVGRNRWPTLSDRKSLKYTEATLLEIQRYCTLAPLGIAHRAITEADLFGYTIPKDTIILTNLHSVHMDKNYWKYPTEFKPDRFLDEKGNVAVDDSHYMVFGVGKRRCLGEALGKTSLFLFFTALLHNFIIEPDHECYPEKLPMDGFTLSPKPFKVKLTLRT